MKSLTINQLIENPELANDCYEFYDWFCSDKSLKSRMMDMLPKLKFLVKEGLVDGDTHYVFFKNNCPVYGNLYDDFRIVRIEDEKFKGGFCPRVGHSSLLEQGKVCTFWVFEGEDNYTEYSFKSWSELKSKLKTDENLREIVKRNFKD